MKKTTLTIAEWENIYTEIKNDPALKEKEKSGKIKAKLNSDDNTVVVTSDADLDVNSLISKGIATTERIKKEKQDKKVRQKSALDKFLQKNQMTEQEFTDLFGIEITDEG